jgi:cytochrome c peroxidase
MAAAFTLGFVATVAAVTMRPAFGEDAPGLKLFKKNGCNECHAISSLGVEKDAKKKTETATAESETKKKKKDPPDLSGAGLEHDAKWISAFLNKEEAIDGEKHEKRFKGSESDRRTIAMWLATLKTAPKKAPAEAKPAAGENPGAAVDTSKAPGK